MIKFCSGLIHCLWIEFLKQLMKIDDDLSLKLNHDRKIDEFLRAALMLAISQDAVIRVSQERSRTLR